MVNTRECYVKYIWIFYSKLSFVIILLNPLRGIIFRISKLHVRNKSKVITNCKGKKLIRWIFNHIRSNKRHKVYKNTE